MRSPFLAGIRLWPWARIYLWGLLTPTANPADCRTIQTDVLLKQLESVIEQSVLDNSPGFISGLFKYNWHIVTLQDVSDLLEKEAEDSVKVRRLESNSLKVVHKDWSQHITEDLRAGTVNAVLFVTSLAPIIRLLTSHRTLR